MIDSQMILKVCDFRTDDSSTSAAFEIRFTAFAGSRDSFPPVVRDSQRVLLALTQAGITRDNAYRLVQRNAMKVWEHGADFMAELKADPEVTAALTDAEIEEKFDLGYHTKHVDTIFARVFGEG